MNIFICVMVFIFGLIFGSFYNVVGYRVPKKESIVFPSSNCPNCKHKLKFYENIPLLSYIFLGGKCKCCKKRISIIYPLIFPSCDRWLREPHPQLLQRCRQSCRPHTPRRGMLPLLLPAYCWRFPVLPR